jgi:hypothetical protein
MNLPTNLTELQSDYAVFLPALSTFYALFVGRQRRGLLPYDENLKASGTPYIDLARIPQGLPHGVESLNWLAPEGLWKYKWSLHSAGHASLDLEKDLYREDQYRDRDRETSWLLGDSGGFQIGKGKWEGDWRAGSGCERAQKKRDGVLRWMDKFMDYGMILDIPAWVDRSPEGSAASKISSYQEAADGTKFNNEYFIKNRNGNCKFLNVLQGENFAQADDWYEQMKHFSDPKQYPDAHFNGWAMGGQNMCDLHLALKRVVILGHDGLLEKGKQDLMHFLGTSKLEWAMVLTAIQRGIRKQFNENFTVTFDCASPFLATSNGTQYTGYRLEQEGKWSYIMESAPDDKALHADTTPFDLHCDKLYENWMPSPLSQLMKLNDITIYSPTDVNRMGVSTNTSWDSFSYMLLMNHNVYTHLRSVQEANRVFDEGKYPYMLVEDTFDKTEVKDVIAHIFTIDDKDKQLQMIDDYERLWMKVVGTRGHVGKKSVNSSAQFFNLFEEV